MAPAKLKDLDLGQNNGEHCLAAADFYSRQNAAKTPGQFDELGKRPHTLSTFVDSVAETICSCNATSVVFRLSHTAAAFLRFNRRRLSSNPHLLFDS
jgi:hypothetical protein